MVDVIQKAAAYRDGKHTPEYESFHGMKKRCFNKNSKDYKDYGGRGVSICDEWMQKDGFARFFEHIGERPGHGYSLDRIDTNKGYEPGNVRWVCAAVQSRNRRYCWLIKIAGEWTPAKDASVILGIAYSSLVNACRGVQSFPKGFNVPEFKRKY